LDSVLKDLAEDEDNEDLLLLADPSCSATDVNRAITAARMRASLSINRPLKPDQYVWLKRAPKFVDMPRPAVANFLPCTWPLLPTAGTTGATFAYRPHRSHPPSSGAFRADPCSVTLPLLHTEFQPLLQL
jgi:hypothetical protein